MRGRLRRGQRGAAIVEAAIVLPAVVMLLFGMLEGGLYFKDSLTVSESTKDAAHTGAMYAADSGADYWIIQAMKRASLNGIVQEIIVYDAANVSATNPSAQAPPANCLASSAGVQVGYTDSSLVVHTTGAIGSCNVYIAANGDFNHPLSDFTGGTFTNAMNWPGANRLQSTGDVRYLTGNNQQAGAGPDFIGVWVKTTHNWATGFIATSPTKITDQAVFRIEPRQ
jgi:Flp pilus assembly protein TadG